MILTWLVACQSDPEAEDPQIRQLTDDQAVFSSDPSAEWPFGNGVAGGGDLDHDGVREWAVSVPREEDSRWGWVVFFQGREEVARRDKARFAREEFCLYNFGEDITVDDVNGDGFDDFLLAAPSACWDEPSTTRIYTSIEKGGDQAIEVGTHDIHHFSTARPTRVDLDDGPAWLVPERYSDLYGQWSIVRAQGYPKVWSTPPEAKVASVAGLAGEPVAIDLDGDGLRESWLGGWATHEEGGHAFICPATAPLDLDDDCMRLGEPGDLLGLFHAAGDLDGDGREELVSGSFPAYREDGEVQVFDLDGQHLARVVGTQGDLFGQETTILTDDDGQGWLLVADNHRGLRLPRRPRQGRAHR